MPQVIEDLFDIDSWSKDEITGQLAINHCWSKLALEMLSSMPERQRIIG